MARKNLPAIRLAEFSLLTRAFRAYVKRFGHNADMPSWDMSSLDQDDINAWCVTLRNSNGVLARYRLNVILTLEEEEEE